MQWVQSLKARHYAEVFSALGSYTAAVAHGPQQLSSTATGDELDFTGITYFLEWIGGPRLHYDIAGNRSQGKKMKEHRRR